MTLYSLRKWAGMAAKGNATALHFLFAEPKEVDPKAWKKIQAKREVFLSRNSAKQFLGFADDQFKRLTGEKGSGKKGQRPEYIGKFGYDTKAAMHGLRLLYECLELMAHRRITLPRPEKDLLIEVRSGEWPLERVLAHAKRFKQKWKKQSPFATAGKSRSLCDFRTGGAGASGVLGSIKMTIFEILSTLPAQLPSCSFRVLCGLRIEPLLRTNRAVTVYFS